MNDRDRKLIYREQPNGSTYVYEILDHQWDKVKKQGRTKQVYLGRLDPKTGEIIPKKGSGEHAGPALNEAVTARTTISGPALILKHVDRRLGLSKALRKACPDTWQEILSLAWFLLANGSALIHAESWCRNHEVPSNESLSSQRISELLDSIDEDQRQSFFKLWGQAIAGRDYLCYDITSISSYAEQNEYVRWGYNRDGESLPQINLGMVYGQQSMLPLAYRQLPGSVNDVKTVEHLLHQCDKLGFSKLHLVMDRGFYSRANIDHLALAGHHFTQGVPSHLRWIRDIIDEDRDLIDGPQGYHKTVSGVVYAHTRLLSWGETKRRCYLHLYFDPDRMARDRVEFDNFLAERQTELIEERRLPAYEDSYHRFFTWKRTPKRGLQVAWNWEAVTAARKQYVGFTALLSTKLKDPLEALAVYREKDVVEKCFDDLKNELDMKRLRVHKAGRMSSRLFIQFIALILLASIRQTVKQKLPQSKYSAKSILWEMESLTTIHYSGKYKNKLSEITKAQRTILDAFEVDLKN